ncbi:MAG: cytosine deaminase, partial [Gammaproteobacteria bacterium]|nr:cytosine deaminase [Gammaproteobacteria bacterium]
DRARVIDKLGRAGITVIALPRTNLYLQDRDSSFPLLRGIAPVKELLEAGVAVRFASDNVRDAFYPFGDADLLGVALDGMLATHVDDAVQAVAAICDGRSGFSVGDSADLVVVPGADVDTVFAERPAQRWIMQAGALARAGLAEPAG